MSHSTYHARKSDADAEYLGRVKIALSTVIGGISFADPVNTRKAHEELMNQVRNKAIHVSHKYKVKIEPFYIEWNSIKC